LAQARFAPTALIVEGRSIAGVHVGDSRAQVVHRWGAPDDPCRRSPEWNGTVCDHLGHLQVTYDGTSHVVAILVTGRVNVTQPRVPANARRGVYATRAGIGPFVAQNTIVRHYGRKLTLLPRRTDPGFGGVNRTWVVRGPAGRVTLFGVEGASGGRNGGQITRVTVARALVPVITGPARLGLGTVAPVAADGLVPGLPYRVDALFPGSADPVPLAATRADARGHIQVTVAYDGALAEALAAASTATAGDLAGSLRAVAMDGDEPPSSRDRRPFWLGPIVASAPVAIAAPAVTMTVEPAGPLSFDTPLTVRFGGVVPTTLQGDQAPHLSYELVFQAPCGDPDQHVFQDPVAGVLSLPGAADQRSPQRAVRFACADLPAGQAVTVPLVLFRDVDLASGSTRRLVAAEVPLTFLRP
jgi:hypothetical protein